MRLETGRTLTFIHSSGERPYRLLMNAEKDVLRVKLGGEWPYSNPSAFVARVCAKCREYTLKRVLIMFHLNQPIELCESYALASAIAEAAGETGMRVAVVDQSLRSFANPQFWQTAVAADSGVVSFSRMDDAAHWLQNQSLAA